MRLVTVLVLLIMMFFVSGFAYAAASQSGQSPVISGQPDVASCPNPVTVTNTVGSQLIFAGPKVGWLKVPIQVQTPGCAQALK